MHIIGNTNELIETKDAIEHFLISYGFNFLKMDFKENSNNNYIWTNKKNNILNKLKNSANNPTLTLEEIITVLGNQITPLINLKISKKDYKKSLERLIQILKSIKNAQNILIESTDISVIKELLVQKEEDLFELGLSLTKHNISKNLKEAHTLKSLDFIVVPSSLIEQKSTTFELLKSTFPSVDLILNYEKTIYKENEKELESYLEKMYDGIIVNEPYTVKRILQKQTLPK